MKRLPIDLSLKTVSTKVSVKAWERAQELKQKHDVRLSDVVSACLLHMPEDILTDIFKEQQAIVDALPRAVKGLLGNIDKLDDAQRAMLRDILS